MKNNLKLNDFLENWILWLIIITSIAVIIRSIPAWTNVAWGCDFGIYYGLTNSFIKSGNLINSYYGWGDSYQYFPVLYTITGISHWITGIDVIVIMPKLAPIFGGLSIMIFYFIVNELIGNKKIAIFSSLILAVLPFHAYQTSHASPLTMGHFFMMLSMYFFIKYRQNYKYVFPLFISTILLIISHHFTTYFYLISMAFIIFFENFNKREWTPSIKLDIFYLLLTSTLIFSYWIIIATPVYTNFMSLKLRIFNIPIGPNIMISLFYLFLLLSFLIIFLKRRLNIYLKPSKPSVKSCFMKFSFSVIICLIVMIIFSIFKMPWTNFSLTPLSIIYSIPLIVIIGFGVAGFRYTRFIKNGYLIRGWLISILLSFIYGLFTYNWTFYPHRHLEYMMIPISIISVYGIRGIFLNLDFKIISKSIRKIPHFGTQFLTNYKKNKIMKKRQIAYVGVIIILATTNAVSIYPSHIALNVSYEAITGDNISVIHWLEQNINKNNSIIASDHRLARIVEAAGFNTTLDETILLWNAENITIYIDELYGINKNHSKITHIIIDYIMKEKVVHVGFGKIIYMTNKSYDKFNFSPFELIYRNSTINREMEEIHWSEVYKVNWSYINSVIKI